MQDSIIEAALRTSLGSLKRSSSGIDGVGSSMEGVRLDAGEAGGKSGLPDRPWAVFTAGAMVRKASIGLILLP